MSFSSHKMLYLCVNARDYRTTIKLHDIKFKKTDSIWNQLFQKLIILEVRLRRFNPFRSTGTHMSQLGGIQVICPILFRNVVYFRFLLPWSHEPVTTRVAIRILLVKWSSCC